ncbi:MAG: kelch repeat-containing protein [Candidatus Eisenbacteria bacterium]
MSRITSALVAFVLIGTTAVVADAWTVTVDSRDNAIDLCASSFNNDAATVALPWYRGIPYTVSMSSAQAPVYFDSSHLGSFQGVHLDGIIGTTEATRTWMVDGLEPGTEITIPPSYKNIETLAYIPECGNLVDNSGAFELEVTPTAWGSWPSVPGEPVGIAAILDPETGAVYTFGGGCNDDGFTNITHWLNPNSDDEWAAIPAGETGPSARWFASAIYDPNPGGNRRMVIHGGAIGTTSLSDVWALDLVTQEWTFLSDTGPSCRYHRAVYDANPNGNPRMLIHGDSHHIGEETWAYDLVTNEWTMLHGSAGAPPPRGLAGLAMYEPEGGPRQLLVFGGGHLSVYRNDLWSLNLDTLVWTELMSFGDCDPPPAREAARIVIDPAHDTLIMFGGKDAGSRYNDVWYYGFWAARWWSPTVPTDGLPSERSHHAMVYDPNYSAMVVIGGINQYPCEETIASVYIAEFDEEPCNPSSVSPNDTNVLTTMTSQAWPVPTDGIVRIRLDLPQSGPLEGAIYDANGARVHTFTEPDALRGDHVVEWDLTNRSGERVPAGVYFYRFRAGNGTTSGRVVTVR